MPKKKNVKAAKNSKDAKIAAAKKKLRQFKQNKEKEAADMTSEKPNTEKEENEKQHPMEEMETNGVHNKQQQSEEVTPHPTVGSTQSQQQVVTEDIQVANANNNHHVVMEQAVVDDKAADGEASVPLDGIQSSEHGGSELNEDFLLVDENLSMTEQPQSSQVDIPCEEDSSSAPPPNNPPLSSSSSTTESLIQMSTKLNNIAEEASLVSTAYNKQENTNANEIEVDHSFADQLQERNQELVGNVTNLKEEKVQMTRKLETLTLQISQVQTRMEQEKQNYYIANQKEQQTYQHQIQVQMHTIGVLVAEKQELQHQLHENKTLVNQHLNARQQYQDELKDSKLNLQTLEREGKTKANEISSLQKMQEDLKEERENLQQTVKNLKGILEENKLHSGELSQKLLSKEHECSQLNEALVDKNEKLSMAEVLLQQLSNGSGNNTASASMTSQLNSQSASELEQLRDERESLNQKLVEYQQAFEQLTGEREQLSRQYADVNEQMKNQVSQLVRQVELLEYEKGELIETQHELNCKISTIEVRNDREVEDSEQVQTVDLSGKVEELEEHLSKLRHENEDLEKKLQIHLTNNQQLARLNEEKEKEIESLGHNIMEQSVSMDEHSKLVEQSHNDRTALSRALIQNKQLKSQLEELQEGFVKLSNTKMELTNQIASFQFTEKELQDDLQTTKEKLSTQRHADNEKADQERHHVVMKQELEASMESFSLLSEENQQLKLMIGRLQNELDESMSMSMQVNTSSVEDETGQDDDVTQADEVSDEEGNVSVSKQQENLMKINEELSSKVEELEKQIQVQMKMSEENAKEMETIDNAAINVEESEKEENVEQELKEIKEKYEALEKNMSLLQDRFSLIMRQRCDAVTRVEDLEHINLQLQNECDTIGEYITLYHNQRKALQQRHHEKDQYISMMAQERDAMQEKLEKLEQLVARMISENPSTYNQHQVDQNIVEIQPVTHTQLAEPSCTEEEEEEKEEDTKPSSDEDHDNDQEDSSQQLRIRPDLLPPDHHTVTSSSHMTSLPGKLRKVSLPPATTTSSSAADEIMDLLGEMKKKSSHKRKTFDRPPPKGFCMKYSGRYTSI